MQMAVRAQAVDGSDFAIRRAECRNQAAVYRLTIQPNSASAAIALVASLFDPEPAQVADEGSQTLPRPRFGIEKFSVNLVMHESLRRKVLGRFARRRSRSNAGDDPVIRGHRRDKAQMALPDPKCFLMFRRWVRFRSAAVPGAVWKP